MGPTEGSCYGADCVGVPPIGLSSMHPDLGRGRRCVFIQATRARGPTTGVECPFPQVEGRVPRGAKIIFTPVGTG